MFSLAKPLKSEKAGASLVGFGEMQHEMECMHNGMERLFDAFLGQEQTMGYSDMTWYPAVDVCEKEGKFILKAELPGMSEKDIQVSVEDNMISLRGEKHEETELKGKYQHRLERTSGKFYRSFQLPSSVDAEKAEAHYRNGVLELQIPKSEQSKPKLIKID